MVVREFVVGFVVGPVIPSYSSTLIMVNSVGRCVLCLAWEIL